MANNKKNEVVTVNQSELVNSTFTDSNALYNAVVARSGESHIEVKKDSDGNEYATATYQLKVAKGDRKEITIRNMDIATRIERVNRALATGDVSYFITAKEISNFADTDAIELGFENVTSMCTAIFGLAKSTIENYSRLAKYFINDDFTLRGGIPSDTPISTLNQMLSLVKKEDENGVADISNVERLFTSGIITPYMKQAEVKARLAKLNSMETDKEISELDYEEMTTLQNTIVEDAKNRAENKGKKKEKKEEKKENSVTVSDNPVILATEALNKCKELKELLIKLHIEVDMDSITEAINTVIDENA